MMKLICLLLLMVVSVPVCAQHSENRDVGYFDGIRVAQAIDVYLRPGNDEKVEVEVEGIDLREVITRISGSTLKIYLDEGRHRNHKVKVYVTFVSLNEIIASSASGVFSEGTLKGKELEVSVSSAADIELTIDYETIEASASSSGDIELEGRTNKLSVQVSSAGGVDTYDLDADIVSVRASSAGDAKVKANKVIDARASSGASIRYRGNPSKSQTDSSSGGSVRKSN